ncbi:MAG: thiosulfate oxidation carrier complex protein SoxZ [Rhodospirillales bacterium]|nr:thiosulfate oxidation carrier complex protein SoxZ [Rhodospirillales bacterium]
MTVVRIALPKEAKAGEVIEIKTLFQHAMESGHRRDNAGNLVPRQIVNRFVCTYAGHEVFRADLFPAIAANPYVAFHTVAAETGDLVFAWTDDLGNTHTETRRLTVAR